MYPVALLRLGDMMALRVRKSRARDLMAVDALLAQSYPRLLRDYYLPSVLVTAIPLIARARPGLVTSGTYFLCENETGTLLGCGGWTRRGPMGESMAETGHIRHFATHPDAVRRGVGTAIMEACLAQIASTDIIRIECAATRAAVPFYRHFGFEPLEDADIVLRPGIAFPVILMRYEM